MTPLPKKKHTRSRSNKRRSHISVRLANLIRCSSCGKLKYTHKLCPHCGKK